MSLEVACGSCQGRLVVETPGSVVACPHCGHHLTAPDFPIEPGPDPDDGSTQQHETTEQAAEAKPAETSSIFNEPATESLDSDTVALDSNNSSRLIPPTFTAQPAEEQAVDDLANQPVADRSPRSRRRDTVPRTTFLLLLSYASAVTLACFWLFYQLQNVPLHNLERLPDPADTTGSTGEAGPSLTLVAVDSPMPDGHTLELGQTTRFGHIRVTPLRVSREALEFEALEQFDGQATREPIGPVLKLWLQLENASDDQDIAPLDRLLMLSRLYENDRVMANNFIRPGNGESITLLHDNPLQGNWNWKGQGADGIEARVLKPGGLFETYVPTGTDGIDELDGPLVWRVHIRKGYSASGKGVTTIFEVAFDSSQIETD